MELLLEKNELVNMGKRLKGGSIFCTAGRCWVTQEDHYADYILSPGDEFQVLSNGRLVVTATADCRIRVVLPAHNEDTLWARKRLPQLSLLSFT